MLGCSGKRHTRPGTTRTGGQSQQVVPHLSTRAAERQPVTGNPHVAGDAGLRNQHVENLVKESPQRRVPAAGGLLGLGGLIGFVVLRFE